MTSSSSRTVSPVVLSRRRALGAASLLGSLVVLAGCGSSSDSASNAGSSASEAASASSSQSSEAVPSVLSNDLGSGANDGVFPRTVKHYQGETTIESAPKRVVVLSTGQADAVLTLGMCPIGSTAASGTNAPIAQYLVDAFPEQASAISAVTYVGSRTEPDLEAVASLTPDLILTNLAGKDDAETLYQSLSAIAPTVATRGTGQYWKIDLLLLADALGAREAAQGRLNDLATAATDGAKGVDPATTVSLLRKNGDKLRVFGPVSFAGSIVADMGLARPQSQQFTDGVSIELSEETLDQADGDWLFYGVQGGEVSEVTGASLWGSLGAVTAGHAVQVDDDPFFLNAGPTAASTVIKALSASLTA